MANLTDPRRSPWAPASMPPCTCWKLRRSGRARANGVGRLRARMTDRMFLKNKGRLSVRRRVGFCHE